MTAGTSLLICEFNAGECDDGDPVHLVVDTLLKDVALQMEALKIIEAETICLNEMIVPNLM